MLIKKHFEKRILSRHGIAGSLPVAATAPTERLSPTYIRRSRILDMKIDRTLTQAKQMLKELQDPSRK